MIDWSTVFESAKPKPGATDAQVAAFVATLGLPADRPLPPSHLSFVRYSDGGHFQNGDRLFQMYGTGLRAMMDDRDVQEYMPLAVPFAFNGGGVMYLFDMRDPPDANGEYPIICAAAGYLTFDTPSSPQVARSFEEVCRARFRVERLRHGGVVLTADQWDVWTDPKHMLDDCEGRDRKLRLFACACARRVWDAMPDDLSRRAVELAERYADEGLSLDAERRELKDRCEAANPIPRWRAAVGSAAGCLSTAASGAAWSGGWAAAVAEAGANEGPAFAAARAKQADLLREIFGNPLRPVRAESEWLAWNGRTVPLMANRIYDAGAFGDLPILADALEDAGCTNVELLAHLRGPREHVRGCWALDLLRDEPT